MAPNGDEIKLTARVRVALNQATHIVAWAAGLDDPLEVTSWIESIRIVDCNPYENNPEENPFFRDQQELGIDSTPHCQVSVHFEVDRDPEKKFLVILDLAETARKGWRVVECRSGEPHQWFQVHYACWYIGIVTENLWLINSRCSLETNAEQLKLFQFPFRDTPAKIK